MTKRPVRRGGSGLHLLEWANLSHHIGRKLGNAPLVIGGEDFSKELSALTYSDSDMMSELPLALKGLTSVFGMGTGVPPSL